MKEELTTYVAGWSVTYPAACNGRIGDLGFVAFLHGGSDFVHFDTTGKPYGTSMPKAVQARIVAMRNRVLRRQARANIPLN